MVEGEIVKMFHKRARVFAPIPVTSPSEMKRKAQIEELFSFLKNLSFRFR
jgi:hypothetical protein